ncbi:hypothetical protein CMI42_01475 [Candidatus Pacearchaeota archaeon]|nr:hypothetical protein [Candidatus Pacearchaeota archaeon]|tara:strand:- start:755 stop:1222 length:468 start_codon:yes stop_codon:yes gene_type:complete
MEEEVKDNEDGESEEDLEEGEGVIEIIGESEEDPLTDLISKIKTTNTGLEFDENFSNLEDLTSNVPENPTENQEDNSTLTYGQDSSSQGSYDINSNNSNNNYSAGLSGPAGYEMLNKPDKFTGETDFNRDLSPEDVYETSSEKQLREDREKNRFG